MTTSLATIAPKLGKLLPLLASDKPGEVVATAAAIGRTLRTVGADWHDLTRQLTHTAPSTPPPRQPPPPPPPTTWSAVPETARPKWLERMSTDDRLTEWERNFVVSIRDQLRSRSWSALSEKQVAILNRVLAKVMETRW